MSCAWKNDKKGFLGFDTNSSFAIPFSSLLEWPCTLARVTSNAVELRSCNLQQQQKTACDQKMGNLVLSHNNRQWSHCHSNSMLGCYCCAIAVKSDEMRESFRSLRIALALQSRPEAHIQRPFLCSCSVHVPQQSPPFPCKRESPAQSAPATLPPTLA